MTDWTGTAQYKRSSPILLALALALVTSVTKASALWIPTASVARDRFSTFPPGRLPRLRTCPVPSASPPSRAVASVLVLRGGASSVPSALSSVLSSAIGGATGSPAALFDSLLAVLVASAVAFKASDRWGKESRASDAAAPASAPAGLRALQVKFLSAFWLFRCGYWMSGAYIVPAYRSKFFGGQPASVALVSKIFLSGFVATAALRQALALRRILCGWVWPSAPLGRWGRLATPLGIKGRLATLFRSWGRLEPFIGAPWRLGADRDASRRLGLARRGPRRPSAAGSGLRRALVPLGV